jgi:saccharopine dehydrogenase-like NADP-dependent oxidoreductase
MTKRVLIIGGYGNFGSYIARSLADDTNVKLLIAGRSLDKARKFISQFAARNTPEPIFLDIHGDIVSTLADAKPDIVIHTTGPFQNQSYAVVEACIKQGCHYIDLADARRYVTGITQHDAVAKENDLLIVSGASSVPCLTAAIIDHYRQYFQSLEIVEYGISAAQQTNRGLATVSAIFSYVGKPFTTLINGMMQAVYGWQDLHTEKYPELGWRLFGNCDIPDLELFPKRYPVLKTIRFSAGYEVFALHVALWFLSWLVRLKIVSSLERLAPFLLKASFLFDVFGTSRSGLHMFMSGIGNDGTPTVKKFYIIARQGHGPNIPCVPAILLAKGLANGSITTIGARPCLDLIDLATYLDALRGLDISIIS